MPWPFLMQKKILKSSTWQSLKDNRETENPLEPSVRLCHCHRCLGCVCRFLHLFCLHWSSCNARASLVAACGLSFSMGFRGGKESACQSRRSRFDTWVRGDSLEEDMAVHTSILAWRISWTEEPGWLQSTGVTKSWTPLSNWHFSLCGILVSQPGYQDLNLVSHSESSKA